MGCSVVWFRLDLRTEDNPALTAALARREPVLPLFIWSPEEEAPWEPGGASRWWLHHSLKSLQDQLEKLGSPLVIRRGPSLEVLRALGASHVYWNRRYEPKPMARDTRIKASLEASGIQVESFNSALLFEPWQIENGERKPFQVFTAYWKKCLREGRVEAPLPAPRKILAPRIHPPSEKLEALGLLPAAGWGAGLAASWEPGAPTALRKIRSFLGSAIKGYETERDFPSRAGTSLISPHLHFGEISPRQIWDLVHEEKVRRAHSIFLKELGWREFAHHLLYHYPHTPTEPLREKFRAFPWRKSAKDLRAWQQGQTGYPIVDAGMRQLWQTGMMHNRVRMIAGSFLTKHLRIPWQAGARWFWDTLVDADLASNTLGWQWIAGCGADAAPYFRVFNPVLQGEKFDPGGEYVRRYVPELSKLETKWIHKPWQAPAKARYVEPVVDHATARAEALEAFSSLRPHGVLEKNVSLKRY